MTMFLFGVVVLTVAVLPAPTPHNQQIFTLAELMKLQISTIITTMTSSDTPWNRTMNVHFNELMFANKLFHLSFTVD